jgi:serine/threonine protein kinase
VAAAVGWATGPVTNLSPLSWAQHASAPKWHVSDRMDGRREDFELGALLGRGSYACVYRARSRHSGDEVAIKIIEKQLIAASPGLAERVRAEAETHIALDHPSIVKLLTFFEDSSCVYLVLELCEGGELYHHLRRSGGGLPEGEARDMLLMLLEGMNYLHAQNIVHRDLKLSNLLLTKERRVKISDFGLSTVLEGQCGESGTMCGTPNYMPPEVVHRHSLKRMPREIAVMMLISPCTFSRAFAAPGGSYAPPNDENS